ncbi:hypothetical protein B0H11DRAFT_2264699 [Mycena galericulata]|nr:hypothetical protein B0H11DRAFT_2264699 [Mycena galericulata]
MPPVPQECFNICHLSLQYRMDPPIAVWTFGASLAGQRRATICLHPTSTHHRMGFHSLKRWHRDYEPQHCTSQAISTTSSAPTMGEPCSPAVGQLGTQSGFKADIPTHRGTKVLNLAFKSLSMANERASWSVLGDKIPQDTALVPLLQLKSPKLALTYLAHELRTPSCIDQQWEQCFEDIHNTSPTTELLEPLTP